MPHVPYCPCALLPMCPIPQGPPSVSAVLTKIPFTHVPHCPCTPLPMCHIAHVSKRCQVVKRMSNCQKRCQMLKSQTHGLWRRFTKKINWHNEVHTYWRQFWRHIWWSPKTLKMCIESVFEQFWSPSYLTSKLTSICVNLIMSIYFFLWTSSIVHVFDFLGGLSLHLNHLIP